MRRALLIGVAAGAALLAPGGAAKAASKPGIERGFHLLYELKFDAARAQFRAWEESHPEDALGAASEAASYLFEEFYRQGVLTSEFFLDDHKLLGGVDNLPDPESRRRFLEANARAQSLARRRLRESPKDAEALFVLTITTGMRSNYTALIEKQSLKSLKLIREAEGYANKLLAVQPDALDAYLSLGATNYIIGCLPGYKRFFLWFGGIHGDRGEGMRQLEIAANGGHYLRPYAKIFLALAALREKQPELARAQLEALVAEFPQNSLFQRELALLENSMHAASDP
jgi:hypothetical protein